MKINSQQITLTRDGRWLHGGVEITHVRTKELFFKSILYQNNKYFLTGEKIPVSIVVEDVAFFVKSIKQVSGTVILALSNQQTETLDCTTLELRNNNELICRLQNGAPAKFDRKVYNELMKGLVKRQGYLGLMARGVFYPLQKQDEVCKPKAEKQKQLLSKGASKKIKLNPNQHPNQNPNLKIPIQNSKNRSSVLVDVSKVQALYCAQIFSPSFHTFRRFCG